jgi:ribosome-binding ATPase YchF (GTP1/OBG family)
VPVKEKDLGNKFLAKIREVDAIIHVIRCFADDNIVHVAGGVDPVFDKEVIDTELQLKDLESVEKKIAKVERTAKSGDAKAKRNWLCSCSIKMPWKAARMPAAWKYPRKIKKR